MQSYGDNLSPRELDVVKCLAEGITKFQAIADTLHISKFTVATHCNNIYDKLQVRDRTQVLVKCVKQGLLKIEVE